MQIPTEPNCLQKVYFYQVPCLVSHTITFQRHFMRTLLHIPPPIWFILTVFPTLSLSRLQKQTSLMAHKCGRSIKTLATRLYLKQTYCVHNYFPLTHLQQTLLIHQVALFCWGQTFPESSTVSMKPLCYACITIPNNVHSVLNMTSFLPCSRESPLWQQKIISESPSLRIFIRLSLCSKEFSEIKKT